MQLGRNPYVVHGVRNGPRQETRFALYEIEGERLVDIRIFRRRRPGEWYPTARGCTFTLDQIEQIEMAIAKMRHVLEAVPAVPPVPAVA